MSFYGKGNAYPAEQTAYMERVSEILKKNYGGKPSACIITYGCQQNVSDSERIKGMLVSMGYQLTDEPEDADFILFNTCAVREHAEDRVYGNVGSMKKYKKARPGMILAVCGCMVQQSQVAEKFKKSYPYVDMVFGTQVQHRLPEFIYKRLCGSARIFELSLENNDIVEDIPISRDGDIKGWLPIMYGCNNFCTYCIVPYVRGRERSRKSEEIINEAKRMIDAGYKEIMLLGQNVNSYSPEGEEINFAGLLRCLNNIDGDFRIRFMTSHPKDCTIELLDAMRDCEKVEKHLHLPVQSGSDRILKIMNRRYDTEKYSGLIKSARERMPDITFTSDIIVGFPGETYEDFKKTVEIVKETEYLSLFTFIYSPRTGTPAASMEDPVSREEKGRWFGELLAVQEKISEKILKSMLGKTVRVLCDDITEDGLLSGKSDNMLSVEFEGDKSLKGKFVHVKLNSFSKVFSGTVVK